MLSTESGTPGTMPARERRLLVAALTALAVAASGVHAQEPGAADALSPPPMPREFRGVWVATVGNIDWPSRKGLSTGQQQRELLNILDRAAELNLNAVILQVRPAADAFYDSELEPWSEYLTGSMGQPPDPPWDPLAFAVEQAHARGLELHAWFNPFRARNNVDRDGVSADHISRTHPELVREYGDQLWMDPGELAVRDHTIGVILDVVSRYDIDGVHIDDYFYPYPVVPAPGDTLPFPDDPSWQRYVAGGGTLSRQDWRRQNVDQFIQQLYTSIKAAKPWVKFGISPFGTWRPGYPPAISGYDAYANLYADARKWLWRGWLDYAAPQLYWPISRWDMSFPILLGWWDQQNLHGRHLWPGLIPSRVGDPSRTTEDWSATEILRQIYVTRGQHGASGNILFSMRALMGRADSVARLIRERAYTEKALVPASTWLDATPPAQPVVSLVPQGGGFRLSFRTAGEPAWQWVVQVHYEDGRWESHILPGAAASLEVDPGGGAAPDAAFIKVLDRYGNGSRPVRVDAPQR